MSTSTHMWETTWPGLPTMADPAKTEHTGSTSLLNVATPPVLLALCGLHHTNSQVEGNYVKTNDSHGSTLEAEA